MTYIVSVGPLTFKFDECEFNHAMQFAEAAAMSNTDGAIVTIRMVPPTTELD